MARRGKPLPLLLVDTIMESYRRGYFAKTHKVKWFPGYYRQFNDARWFGSRDIGKYQAVLREKANDKKNNLLALADDFKKRILKLRRLSDKLSQKNFQLLDNSQLVEIFSDWFSLNKQIWCFAYDYIFVNKFLPDIITSVVAARVPDFAKQNEILGILFGVDEPTELRLEKKALIKIVIQIKQKRVRAASPEILRLIDKHLGKFAHLGFYYFRGAAYQQEDILKRIKEYLAIPGSQFKEILADFRKQDKNKYLTAQYVKKLNLDEQTANYIRYVKRWGAVSSQVDETYGYSVHKLMPLWIEIIKRLEITYKQFYCLRGDEIIAGLNKGRLSQSLKKEVKSRHDDHAIILQSGKIRVLAGKKLKQYSKRQKQKEEIMGNITELKGQPASPGAAVGRVRIIFSVHDVPKVERGDILVASATNPTFVPAMERAGAVVTDEGGLLSHAAIVSRELKIPCVVGTKIATKVLKDGDKVEVDANKGLVRKL